MAKLSLQSALPASTSWYRGFRLWLQRLALDEVRFLLIVLAALLCLLVLTPLGSRQNLDERAMLSAMLAAGGMPLVYSPPGLCSMSNQHVRFDSNDIRTLLRN
jgi:hypothetical protein